MSRDVFQIIFKFPKVGILMMQRTDLSPQCFSGGQRSRTAGWTLGNRVFLYFIQFGPSVNQLFFLGPTFRL